MDGYLCAENPVLSLGRQVFTPGLQRELEKARYDWQWYVAQCLYRHARGDWGNVCADDARTNNEAVQRGGRVISSYAIDPFGDTSGHGDNAFWIITEADRSCTTVLLASEY